MKDNQDNQELTEEQNQLISDHKKLLEEDPKYKELDIASKFALDSANKQHEVFKYLLEENFKNTKRIDTLEKLIKGEEK